MRHPTVFLGMDRPGVVHHRALNSPAGLGAASLAARLRPDLAHVVEGDLCWIQEEGRTTCYLWHPRRVADTLALRDVEAEREAGRLLTLDDVLAHPDPALRYVFELKVGRGDLDMVLTHVAGRLQEALPHRYWVDAFSIRHLEVLKRLDPAVPTSLHTVQVRGGWALRLSPEAVPFSFRRLVDLDIVDAITLSWRNGWWNRNAEPNSRMQRAALEVQAAGKALVVGGLPGAAAFLLARSYGALAGYARFPLEELPELEAPRAASGGEGPA